MAKFSKRQDYYVNTKYFEPTQPNPTEIIGQGSVGDCVIRSFCCALGMDWLTAFDTLCERARKNYMLPNDVKNYRGWLKEHGFNDKTFKAVKGQKRMTAEQFAKEHPTGAYILECANHNTSVVDGKIRDSWNTSNKCVYRVWTIREH